MHRFLAFLALDGALHGTFLALWQPEILKRGFGLDVLAFYLTFETVFSLVTDIPTGALSDRIGHRKVALWGILLYPLTFFFPVFSGETWAMIACAMTLALAGSFISGAMDSWISGLKSEKLPDFFRRDQAATFGRMLGALLLPGIATLLSLDQDRSLVWLPVFLVSIACAVIALTLPREEFTPAPANSQKKTMEVFTDFFSSAATDLKAAWADQTLKPYLFISLLIGATDGACMLAFRPRIVEIGVTAAVALGGLQAGMSLGRLSGLTFLRKLQLFQGKTAMVSSLVFSSIISILFAATSLPFLAVAFWVLRCAFLAPAFPSLKAGAAESETGKKRMATVLSAQSTLTTLGMVGASSLLSSVGVSTLGLQTILYIAAGLLLVGAWVASKAAAPMRSVTQKQAHGPA